MGLISNAINSAFESFGSSMMNVGEWMMSSGYNVWKGSGSIALQYAQKDPMSVSNAWGTVTGSIYSTMLSVAAALAVLFFVLGWLNESIDIRTNFTLESMFRFFVRYVITASLIVNSLTLATGITRCATALVSTLSAEVESEDADGLFDEMKEELESSDADGGTWLAYGIVAMIGGVIGGLVIIVCAVQLILSVLSRLFKMLLCIPFAPVAFAGFAGGREFSQSGIAWLKTYVGYCLEAVVIILAIDISYGLFQDTSAFGSVSGVVGVVLGICEYCLPMITACACVKGADTVVRRCLGLG
ncbi:MAG: type IV secretion system protein [Lachnospiraceae bacterium]|nr:type IV secretion system protein [Lachnospiraceae bacterium]